MKLMEEYSQSHKECVIKFIVDAFEFINLLLLWSLEASYFWVRSFWNVTTPPFLI